MYNATTAFVIVMYCIYSTWFIYSFLYTCYFQPNSCSINGLKFWSFIQILLYFLLMPAIRRVPFPLVPLPPIPSFHPLPLWGLSPHPPPSPRAYFSPQKEEQAFGGSSAWEMVPMWKKVESVVRTRWLFHLALLFLISSSFYLFELFTC